MTNIQIELQNSLQHYHKGICNVTTQLMAHAMCLYDSHVITNATNTL